MIIHKYIYIYANFPIPEFFTQLLWLMVPPWSRSSPTSSWSSGLAEGPVGPWGTLGTWGETENV